MITSSTNPGIDGPIALAALGGTIAMQRDGGHALQPSRAAVDRLVETARAGIHSLHILDVDPKPSPHVDENDMIRLAGSISDAFQAGECVGAVVTHGTDTLEETAFALDILVADDAPVIVTGAMTAPDFPGSDGGANLAHALAVAQHPLARGLGTLAVLNATIHPAATLSKCHTYRHDAFRASTGPLGEVREDQPVFTRQAKRSPVLPALTRTISTPVPLLAPAPGDDGHLVTAAVDAGAPAIAIAAFGGGHVPPGMLSAISRAAESIPVVVATRCAGGGTLARSYGYAGGEIDLAARGAIFAGYLPPAQARLATSLLVRTGADSAGMKRFFSCFGGGPPS